MIGSTNIGVVFSVGCANKVARNRQALASFFVAIIDGDERFSSGEHELADAVSDARRPMI